MKNKFCPAMWLSGFFGLAAIAHLVRLTAGFTLAINGWQVPKTVSALFVAVAGTLSVGLFTLSIKRPCERNPNE